VINDDEALLNEMRNTVRSRNSLRSKHLAQLEETKANLNEIKNQAAKKFNNSDSEIPSDDQSRPISAKNGSKSRFCCCC
jgi:hypothetical protein